MRFKFLRGKNSFATIVNGPTVLKLQYISTKCQSQGRVFEVGTSYPTSGPKIPYKRQTFRLITIIPLLIFIGSQKNKNRLEFVDPCHYDADLDPHRDIKSNLKCFGFSINLFTLFRVFCFPVAPPLSQKKKKFGKFVIAC